MTVAIADDPRWQRLASREPAGETFVYAVVTTGIFCRPGCASRLPNPENVRFFADAEAALQAGFRACKRCRPETVEPLDALVERATAAIDAALTAPSVEALADELRASQKTLTRAFKVRLGVTPKAFIQARRRQRLQASLAAEPRVTDAIYAAGYGASSRFYSEAEGVLGMTPGRYRARGAGLRLRFATTSCPLGRLLVAASETGVAMIAMGDDDAALVADLRERFAAAELVAEAHGLQPLLEQVVVAIDEPACAKAIPLDIRGTAFQQRVWAALRAIPPGETRTYGEIATALGKPKAVRAVANACAGNPVAVAVPCHRVVPAAGGLGGYRWGSERKRRLLASERADAM